jgi:hypothetical protein
MRTSIRCVDKVGVMETMGDADELSPEEEPESTDRINARSIRGIWPAVRSAEALSIAAFAVSTASLLGSGVLLQVLTFAIFSTGGPPGEPDLTRVIAAAHGGLAVAGGLLAVVALRPRRADKGVWVPALAGAALIMSLLVCVLAMAWWLLYDPAGPSSLVPMPNG